MQLIDLTHLFTRVIVHWKHISKFFVNLIAELQNFWSVLTTKVNPVSENSNGEASNWIHEKRSTSKALLGMRPNIGEHKPCVQRRYQRKDGSNEVDLWTTNETRVLVAYDL